MQPFAKIRVIAAAFALATLVHAQTPQPAPAAQPSPLPAEVTYTEGRLSVLASNSSLNQILRDIARETRMKITGGVADERVFGQYGPDLPSKVLGELLDGTGSNMLLLQATAAAPAELILTPRHGGPSPPNPNDAALEESPVNRPFPPPPRPGFPTTGPEQSAPLNPAASNPAQPQSPNAVKTPQQIYEQLQRIRRRQAGPQ